MGALAGVRRYWDEAAADFDAEADHGLADPAVRAAWTRCLSRWLPDRPADVLDAGCGTGSLSLLAAAAGHRVLGVDLAPAMVSRARDKCRAAGAPGPGRRPGFVVGDAADPPVRRERFEVVLARHLLWTLPDPIAALRRWIGVLRPAGRLVLIEGRWDTGADGGAGPYAEGAALPWAGGVGADTLRAVLRPLVDGVTVEPLADPLLWGRTVTDERYALVARIP